MRDSPLAWLLMAITIVILAIPAVAAGQAIQPTDEQYGEGPNEPVNGQAGGGGGGGGSSDGGGISELPFTGLDLVAIAAIGIGLLGAGLVIRRAGARGRYQA
jgi:hypothetical protein